MRTLASRIAKLEGKKSQVSIGNIREVLSCICKLEAEATTQADSPLAAILARSSELIGKTKKGKK